MELLHEVALKTQYSYRVSHLNRGTDYHQKFFGSTHRAMMWGLERDVLRSIAEHTVGSRMLDFACGTGRVIGEVADCFDYSLGVDVSESMLSIAKENVPLADFKCIDLTEELSEPIELGKFDLITAFRFFPNAEYELRVDAIRALSRVLAPGGRLVFNNHKQQSSFVYRIASLVRRRKEGMTHEECLQLVSSSGLVLEEQHHLGVIPFVDRYGIPFPVAVATRIERIASRFSSLARISSNIIYVCRKPTQGE